MGLAPKYILLFSVAVTFLPSALCFNILYGNTETSWGDWSEWDDCPQHLYVVAIRTRIEPEQGSGHDNSAMNSMNFGCDTLNSLKRTNYTNLVKADEGFWGDWTDWVYCPSGFHGIRVKAERYQGGGTDDDRGIVAVKYLCNYEWVLIGQELPYGEWLDRKSCLDTEVLCGLQTRIEPYQGGGLSGSDDSAMNDVNVKCCVIF